MIDANWQAQLKRGLLELCILNLVEREMMHGYKIVKRLCSIPGLVITEGTVYPLLSRLKKESLVSVSFVESPSGPVRKNYQLTPQGRERLRELNRMWIEISKGVEELMVSESESGEDNP